MAHASEILHMYTMVRLNLVLPRKAQLEGLRTYTDSLLITNYDPELTGPYLWLPALPCTHQEQL